MVQTNEPVPVPLHFQGSRCRRCGDGDFSRNTQVLSLGLHAVSLLFEPFKPGAFPMTLQTVCVVFRKTVKNDLEISLWACVGGTGPPLIAV